MKEDRQGGKIGRREGGREEERQEKKGRWVDQNPHEIVGSNHGVTLHRCDGWVSTMRGHTEGRRDKQGRLPERGSCTQHLRNANYYSLSLCQITQPSPCRVFSSVEWDSGSSHQRGLFGQLREIIQNAHSLVQRGVNIYCMSRDSFWRAHGWAPASTVQGTKSPRYC